MADLSGGYQWTRVSSTATATTCISASEGVLKSVHFPANKTGTVTFYDDGAGAANNQIGAYPNTVGSIPTFIPFDARVKNGISYIAGGTCEFTVFWN